MTWNLENFERPAATAEQAVKDRYVRKLKQISELITTAAPDLVGVQEVLAHKDDLAPGCLMISLPRWVLGGTGACRSGPTSAASAWDGSPRDS